MNSLIVVLWLRLVLGISAGLTGGSPVPCDVEGVEVEVPWISTDPCISCKCQANKQVKCDRQVCLNSERCYLTLFGQEKKSCCELCKGCTYKGHTYSNGEEWTDKENPCKRLSCQGGVVTDTSVKCYSPCRNPVPPKHGTCCPTCPGCSEEDAKEGGVQLAMPLTDPCVLCRCEGNSTACVKKACPVLPCPASKRLHKPGTCCPECIGSRRVFKLDGRCLLGMQIFKTGDKFQQDECTHCECRDSTILCERPSCPPLDCWPELRTKEPDSCCARCRGDAQEKKSVCFANGKFYEDGDKWKLEKCTDCSCTAGQVHCAVASCPAASCAENQVPKVRQGDCCPSCVEGAEAGVCTVFGDPHYKTFDGSVFNYQGSCKYVLSKDCANRSFSVEVLNEARHSKAFSWTKSVTVKVNETKIRLGQYLKIHVNHKPVKLPFVELGVVSVFSENDMVLVTSDFGVKVLWDGNSLLEVTVPASYSGQLCGLCGDYNGDPKDDFRTKKGDLAADAQEFGNSWRVGRMKRCTVSPPPSQPEATCNLNPDVRVRALRECNVLKSAVFKPCHRVVSAVSYFNSCLIDSCECRPRDRCYCESFKAYAMECARAGRDLDWRMATGCDGGRCGNGQQFMRCAPACRRTCRKPKRDKSCRRQCRPGCYCPPGTVWHRKRCVPLDECPAQDRAPSAAAKWR